MCRGQRSWIFRVGHYRVVVATGTGAGWWVCMCFQATLATKSCVNPFTPKSDQCQLSPAASPVILHHTVRRTWLFIAYSDERWLYYQFSLRYLNISFKRFRWMYFSNFGVRKEFKNDEYTRKDAGWYCWKLKNFQTRLLLCAKKNKPRTVVKNSSVAKHYGWRSQVYLKDQIYSYSTHKI